MHSDRDLRKYKKIVVYSMGNLEIRQHNILFDSLFLSFIWLIFSNDSQGSGSYI